MKKLLLLTFAVVGFGSINAQNTCATAVNIPATTTSNTFTVQSYSASSTFINSCQASRTSIRAAWYKFTPTSNGELTVSSNLPANNGTTYTDDTRVSIMKGTCTALTCIDYNDDIDPSDTVQNYLSEVTVPVAAGTTYYIEWDNYWYAGATGQQLGLQFSFSFTAQSCVRPGALDFYLPDNIGMTTVSLFWKNAIGAPAAYDVDWSTDFNTAAGAGTTVNYTAGTTPIGTTTDTYTQADLTGLPMSSNVQYYVRSNCGATQSAWQGPNYAYLAVTPPYSLDFEDAAKNYKDGFIGFSLLGTNATATNPYYGDGDAGNFIYTTTSTTAVSDRWGYTRGISLTAGQTATLSFKTRLYASTAGTAEPVTYDVTVGLGQSAADQTTVLSTLTESDESQYNQQTVTFTAVNDGIYFFGLHNNNPATTAVTFLFVDTITIEVATSSTQGFASSSIQMTPNPAKDVVTIKGLDNNLKSVEVIDVNGRVVVRNNYSSTPEAQISLNGLTSGVYMVKITSDKGVSTQKLIKE